MKNKKEIQVLYIITKLELGGAQKVCISLLDGLKSSGHESFLISGLSGPLVKKLKEKGVQFEDYDLPHIKTINYIATSGEYKSAWFKDSEGNILAINQMHI